MADSCCKSFQEYETFMEDSKLDVAGKEKDVEHKHLGAMS